MLDRCISYLKDKEDTYISLLDSMSLGEAIEYLTMLRGFIWLIESILWGFCTIQILLPLNTLAFTVLNIILWFVTAVLTVGTVIINWGLILFTTRRLDKKENDRVEIMWGYLQHFYWQAANLAGLGISIPISLTIIPFLQYLRLHPATKGWTVQMTDQVTENPIFLRGLLLGMAIIISFYLHARFENLASLFRTQIIEWMRNYEFRFKPLHHVLSGKSPEKLKEQEEGPASLILGQSIETGDNIIQIPDTRRQNSVIFGPIGAGKTSTWFIPQIAQDIKHMIHYMRVFAKVSQDPEWDKPHGKQQNYLNGLSVIEPTNDLCRSVYKVAIALGVPKDKIIWLDPSNPDTPSLDLLSGPVEVAAQTMTDIITGLKKDKDDFFSQTERIHLTQHIYLLKEAAVISSESASFGELMRMYNDVYVVVEKREILRKYNDLLQEEIEELSSKVDKITEREEKENLESQLAELQDKKTIVAETLQWFDKDIISPQLKGGVKIQQSGPHKGEPVYQDLMADNIVGLTNILTEMSKKMGMRRVLFRESNFSLDDAMQNGAIILCNTDKQTLGENSAKMLGQIYSLAIQAATYRRIPDVAPMFPLYEDEFPDYVLDSFAGFAAQARKYNVPINIAAQSPAQLALKYGPAYLRSVFSVMLTRATFGDMGAEDAETLSAVFGTHAETTESIQNQEIDLAANSTNNQIRISTTTKEVPNISPSEIMALEKFTIAVRTPGDHKSNVFDKITTKRVNLEELRKDPVRFDLDNSNDRKAYESMKALEQHTNIDFDSIDLMIRKKIKDGKIDITGLQANENETVIQFDETVAKADNVSKNANNDGAEKMDSIQFDDGDDPLSSFGGEVDSTSTENKKIDDMSNEELRNIVEKSVKKSPNGGNGRFDNRIGFDENYENPNKKTSGKDDKISPSSGNKPKVKQDPQTKSNIELIKHNTLNNIISEFKIIQNNSHLSPNKKRIAMENILRRKNKEIEALFPKNKDVVLDRFYDVIKSTTASRYEQSKVDKLDHKTQESTGLNKEVKGLMQTYGDGPIGLDNSNIANYENDTPFDDQDPFVSQEGMSSNEE
ncbi:type IV secretory system conjugative DNA transfer family protein [uncultured Lactobacillus sp.]|uniref:type IV secretory system conjugative DNA transfer family protein n=1 Tax=uncultured Lactobacillus sp. TaxID=153152 RepID=UPI002610E1B3|nr:TraM recognition domain-containing protein [uncultured Lactobacillus sp.]